MRISISICPTDLEHGDGGRYDEARLLDAIRAFVRLKLGDDANISCLQIGHRQGDSWARVGGDDDAGAELLEEFWARHGADDGLFVPEPPAATQTTTLAGVTITLDAAHDLVAAGLPADEADDLARAYREAAAAVCDGMADVRVLEADCGDGGGCDSDWAAQFGLWQAVHGCCRRIDGRWIVDDQAVERTRASLATWIARHPAAVEVEVEVGHRSSIPGANWCRPVGWSPRNRVEGADWYDEDGAWSTEDGEEAGIVIYGQYVEGETVRCRLDDLRVVASGDCRVISPIEIDFA